MMARNIAIGIDLGGSNSRVAAVLNNRTEVIVNAEGSRATPSTIGFSGEEILVGQVAESQAFQNRQSTISNVKSFHGLTFNDEQLQNLIENCSVNVINKDDIPHFHIDTGAIKDDYSASDLLTMIIMKLKEVAQNYIGQDVKDAVIAVPPYFTAAQHQDLIRICKTINLNVVEVIDTSTAAAYAYGIHEDSTDVKRNILVYDMGGSTTNVSVLSVQAGDLTILANEHDASFGGNNFSDNLMSFLKQRVEQKDKVELPPDSEAMWKLKKYSKQVKHNFVKSLNEKISIDCLYNGKDFDCRITKVRFEGLSANLFMTALKYIDNALLAANLDKSQIDEVILAGGACKMVKLQESIGNYFSGKIIKNSVNLDEVVALGAAVRAHSLTDVGLEESMTMLDVANIEVVGAVGGASVSGGNVRDATVAIDPSTHLQQRVAANDVAIGIDLGTTNSCVGVVLKGKVEIIANSQGNRIIPSYVAFTDQCTYVGEAAKLQAHDNLENTIYDAKRLIGRRFNEEGVQDRIALWPFQVINDGGNPKFQVTYQGQIKILTPEEISAMVLAEMKRLAEEYLGHEVKNAVVTVPAYFNDSQRQATIDAGKIANLNILEIINEPTAAAIAYGIDLKDKSKRNVLVYDLGGGTFDVVVLSVQNGTFDVKAVDGDTFLGGGDFDNCLVRHALNTAMKNGMDATNNKRIIGKLKTACELAKRNLTASKRDTIHVSQFIPGHDFQGGITRARFEELCSDLFNKTIDCVKQVIASACLTKNDIDEVVLAGGSTRIPKVQEILQQFFDGKTLNKTVNPDEAVAYGAAVHAAVLSGDKSVQQIFLHDVAPLSLGIDVEEESFTWKMVKRNTPIPHKVTNTFAPLNEHQTNVYISIYEGERKKSSENHLLGNFTLDGITQRNDIIPMIDITYDIDKNGILTVTAQDQGTGSSGNLTVTTNKGRLRTDEIERMISGVQDYHSANSKENDRLAAMMDLEVLCLKNKSNIKKMHGGLSRVKYATIEHACDATLQWLEDNQNGTKQQYRAKFNELQAIYDSNVM